MNDGILVCLYCGELMDMPTEKMIKLMGGVPKCCEYEMLQIDRDKMFHIHKALDKIKAAMEAEMLKGMV